MKRSFAFLGIILIFLFRGAFNTYIFKDDFFLFVTSRADNLVQFLNFFTPYKAYGFYRPVGIEVFYFLANIINNLLITRLVVFAVFFVGLIFLYRVVLSLTQNKYFAFGVTALYSVSSTHVYQLYWLATFQEVAVFTFSAITVYLFIKGRFLSSLIFFVLALLSREEAIVLPALLLLLRYKNWRHLVFFFSLSLITLYFYRINFAQVAIRPEYAPHLNPRLIGNNVLWYSLWSLGFPSFLPDYWPTIFGKPTSGLQSVIQNTQALPYLIFLLGYLVALLIAVINLVNKPRTLKVLIFSLTVFLIFILPMSLIIHKWMVRLTIPLVFIVYFETYVIANSKRLLGVILVILYFIYNIFAISTEERSSTFRFESKIARNTAKMLTNMRGNLSTKTTIYFADQTTTSSGWEGSQKLKLTLSDQKFLEYYVPQKKVRAIYGYEQPASPSGAIVVDSQSLLFDGEN